MAVNLYRPLNSTNYLTLEEEDKDCNIYLFIFLSFVFHQIFFLSHYSWAIFERQFFNSHFSSNTDGQHFSSAIFL